MGCFWSFLRVFGPFLRVFCSQFVHNSCTSLAGLGRRTVSAGGTGGRWGMAGLVNARAFAGTDPNKLHSPCHDRTNRIVTHWF
jgi:hypothetical protein